MTTDSQHDVTPVRTYVHENAHLFLCHGCKPVPPYVRVKVDAVDFIENIDWLRKNVAYRDWILFNMQVWFTDECDACVFALMCAGPKQHENLRS
jgi:hypothetical protein